MAMVARDLRQRKKLRGLAPRILGMDWLSSRVLVSGQLSAVFARACRLTENRRARLPAGGQNILRLPRFAGQRFWAQADDNHGKNGILQSRGQRVRRSLPASGRGGKTVKPAADELGVSPYSIYEWKRKLLPVLSVGPAGKTVAGAGLPDEVARLQKLIQEQQRQIADLTLQRACRKITFTFVGYFEGGAMGCNSIAELAQDRIRSL